MTDRIGLSQLVGDVQGRKITQKQAARYFTFERNPLQPFDFRTAINPKHVDIAHFEHLARDADNVVRSLSFPLQAPARPKTAAARKKAAPSGKGVVAEGDSWFKLPELPLVPHTSIDLLKAAGEDIANLAHWGDTLDDMLSKGEFWPYIDQGDDLLLFSGGGNDVLGGGDLASLLNLYDHDHAAPSDAPYYLRASFHTNLDRIVGKLENGLVKPMQQRKAKKKIIMHGYDYAIPQQNGPWLGGPMASRGLDPVFHAGLCRAIVRAMIDAYNNRLKGLAAAYSDTFVHLDLRGVIKSNQWWDELHGLDSAAQSIAARFRTAIGAAGPTAHQAIVAELFPRRHAA